MLSTVQTLARECGFELSGVVPATPPPEAGWYGEWVERGYGGEMAYLAGFRGEARRDPHSLLPSARSVICVGKLYNSPRPLSTEFDEVDCGWISRFAWGDDYHDVLRSGLHLLASRLREHRGRDFEYKVCVDTAPLLERACARRAGLGWIGKNSCLINEAMGSWFFLGELLVPFEIASAAPPPDRCGSCTRCIDACPTNAIVPSGSPAAPPFTIDSRLCLSYFTIELRGSVPEQHRPGIGNHVFGCDICQDVCPWNRRAPNSAEPAFSARRFAPPLDRLAAISEEEFREMFRHSPVRRARYTGFLRNVAIAMGNSGSVRFGEPLRRLAEHPDPLVAEHAAWALSRLDSPSAE